MPYCGHFSLINSVDAWVVFDIPQYTPKTWINRNRVLHPNGGANWLSVPIKSSTMHMQIKDAELFEFDVLKKHILGKLSHYRKNAPFYLEAIGLIEELFLEMGESRSLVQLNVTGLKIICKYIGIAFNPLICSELKLDFSQVTGPGDWAYEISTQLGASTYINPLGGKNLFDSQKFNNAGVKLRFANFESLEYPMRNYEFVGGLSILDALMWLPPTRVLQYLKDGQSILN